MRVGDEDADNDSVVNYSKLLSPKQQDSNSKHKLDRSYS